MSEALPDYLYGLALRRYVREVEGHRPRMPAGAPAADHAADPDAGPDAAPVHARWPELEALLREGLTHRQIAARLGVSRPTVSMIVGRARAAGLDIPVAREVPHPLWPRVRAMRADGVARDMIGRELEITEDLVRSLEARARRWGWS